MKSSRGNAVVKRVGSVIEAGEAREAVAEEEGVPGAVSVVAGARVANAAGTGRGGTKATAAVVDVRVAEGTVKRVEVVTDACNC